ncbi:MAG: U32 family peptidase [Bacteroidales bacterium]|nr:U32 family peptidase [Bacteroidales bacterium]
MQKIELLAPAKNATFGIEAIKHGADAVYIGASGFGARSAAANSEDDIKELVDFASIYHAKVYVTINTLLFDSELEEARKLMFQLYETGVDAFIIQDIGLLEMDLPPLPLIASTQTHNTTPEKVLFLEKAGFSRVILARELSLEQIKNIRKQSSVPLEAFVHGALCVSYSGQCYMSHAICGRSANRGQCAQPCRSFYTLLDGDGKELIKNQHLLSLKDMNRSESLGEMIDAGISSFKIEGRLKDIGYLKNITAWYRQKLDIEIEKREGFSKSTSGKTSYSFTPKPEASFNRGFTEYFLHGAESGQWSPETPKSMGEFMGKIKDSGPGWIELDGNSTLHNGDGIMFKGVNGQWEGVRINKVSDNRLFLATPIHPERKSDIYRNHNQAFDKQMEGSTAKRTMEIKGVLSLEHSSLVLKVIDNDLFEASAEIEIAPETANNKEANLANIHRQICKTGDTPFIFSEVQIECPELFIPASTLNALRRQAIDTLLSLRKAGKLKKESRINPTNHPYPFALDSFHSNVLNAKAADFYQRHGVEKIVQGFEEGKVKKNDILMTTKHCILRETGQCLLEMKNPYKMPLYITDYRNRFLLQFDCKNCEMNVIADNVYKK